MRAMSLPPTRRSLLAAPVAVGTVSLLFMHLATAGDAT